MRNLTAQPKQPLAFQEQRILMGGQLYVVLRTTDGTSFTRDSSKRVALSRESEDMLTEEETKVITRFWDFGKPLRQVARRGAIANYLGFTKSLKQAMRKGDATYVHDVAAENNGYGLILVRASQGRFTVRQVDRNTPVPLVLLKSFR
jgi:hypothetical protein